MSLCHIWFGVARSKCRGRTRLRRAFARSSIRSAAWSVLRTVSGLASRKNHRRKPSAIRFTPKKGFPRFSSTIFSTTAPGSRHPGRGADSRLSPTSPRFRYSASHAPSELGLTPVSWHTKAALKPSSTCSFTARSFSSYV